MPEFILRGAETRQFFELGDFTCGYIEALFFTNDEILRDKGFCDMAAETVAEIVKTCIAFQEKNRALLFSAYLRGYSARQAGIDFWFTRNGHGAGYWDRKELEPESAEYNRLTAEMVANKDDRAAWDAALAARNALAEKSLGDLLTKAAQPCGESDAYLGDDDLVYVS